MVAVWIEQPNVTRSHSPHLSWPHREEKHKHTILLFEFTCQPKKHEHYARKVEAVEYLQKKRKKRNLYTLLYESAYMCVRIWKASAKPHIAHRYKVCFELKSLCRLYIGWWLSIFLHILAHFLKRKAFSRLSNAVKRNLLNLYLHCNSRIICARCFHYSLIFVRHLPHLYALGCTSLYSVSSNVCVEYTHVPILVL